MAFLEAPFQRSMANNSTPTDVKPEVAKGVEEITAEPLKYKTWLLKVSVHCEGCKRKVKRVLRSIEGVYTTEIDLRQQKVTVNGNVEAETLIKKLEKTGKHAALWPVKAEKKQSKSKNKEKNSDSENCEEPDQQKRVKIVEEPPDEEKPGETGGEAPPKGGGVTVQVKEVKPELRQAVLLNGPEQEKGAVSEGEGGTGGAVSGGGKKKKKKKGNNANSNNPANSTDDGDPQPTCDTPAGAGLPFSQFQGQTQGQGPMFLPGNHSPPRHHPYHLPVTPHYYAPPVYAVSYHTTNPTASYAGSYHAPSQVPSYSRHCYHDSIMYILMEGERSHVANPEPYSPCRSSTFELFSDENPNACSVM